MACLPSHGRIACSLCHRTEPLEFDVTRRTEGDWRITANPLAWGSTSPEVIVLGFSKGPTQAGALASAPHDQIAYKGSRLNVGKILAHVGLIPKAPAEALKREVDQLIANPSGRFHFGSMVRCTVERFDRNTNRWTGTGGGMLDKFVASTFGREVAGNCVRTFLGDLPARTKLIIMFGLGSRLSYVSAARQRFIEARPGAWREINPVAYTDGRITVVHVEHFASQGRLIPDWLGENPSDRARLGELAKAAVATATTSA